MERIFIAIFLLGLICFSNIFAQTEIPTFFEKQTNNTKISSEPETLQFDLSGHQGSINTLNGVLTVQNLLQVVLEILQESQE